MNPFTHNTQQPLVCIYWLLHVQSASSVFACTCSIPLFTHVQAAGAFKHVQPGGPVRIYMQNQQAPLHMYKQQAPFKHEHHIVHVYTCTGSRSHLYMHIKQVQIHSNILRASLLMYLQQVPFIHAQTEDSDLCSLLMNSKASRSVYTCTCSKPHLHLHTLQDPFTHAQAEKTLHTTFTNAQCNSYLFRFTCNRPLKKKKKKKKKHEVQ